MDFVGFRILLAFLIGIALGTEREIHEKTGKFNEQPSATLGIRTFSLITVLGAISGVLAKTYMPLSLFLCGAFFLLLLAFYILDVKNTKSTGITTEIALLYSFVIGLLLTLNAIPIQVTLAVTVGVILLLSQKTFIKNTVRNVQHHELNAFISFAIIALAILPFLPNTTYAINDIPALKGLIKNVGWGTKIFSIDIINPFKLWTYVALITGIDLIGYLLERTIGQRKGWLVASAAGGFVSSTATTQSLAQESRSRKNANILVAAAVLANLISFIQIGLLVLPISGLLFINLLPILITMILVSAGILFYFLKAKGSHDRAVKKSSNEEKKIIDLKAALTFAVLFLVINSISKIALLFFGSSGFLLTSALGAFAGLDAVIINTAQLVGKNIDMSVAILAFIIANAVNLAAKTLYSFSLGSKEFAIKLGISMAIIVGASLTAFFLF